MRLSLLFGSLVVFGSIAAGTGGCEDGGPKVKGACGLEGKMVWCRKDSDCDQYSEDEIGPSDHSHFPGEYHCNFTGNCLAGVNPDVGCDNPSYYMMSGCPPEFCNSAGHCSTTCRTHADCSEVEYCECGEPDNHCAWFECQADDTCPEGTHPYPGSWRCALDPDSKYLQGDCYQP